MESSWLCRFGFVSATVVSLALVVPLELVESLELVLSVELEQDEQIAMVKTARRVVGFM